MYMHPAYKIKICCWSKIATLYGGGGKNYGANAPGWKAHGIMLIFFSLSLYLFPHSLQRLWKSFDAAECFSMRFHYCVLLMNVHIKSFRVYDCGGSQVCTFISYFIVWNCFHISSFLFILLFLFYFLSLFTSASSSLFLCFSLPLLDHTVRHPITLQTQVAARNGVILNV